MKRKIAYSLLLCSFFAAVVFGGQNEACIHTKCCKFVKSMTIAKEEDEIAEEIMVSPVIPIIPGTII